MRRNCSTWCDLLVLGPGSYITPRGLGTFHHVKYVKEQGKKVFFYSLTVEEGRPAMREHLAKASHLYHPTVAYWREVAMVCPYDEA